jgi:F-type H+-transporting ATPase subunit delta
MSIHKNYVKAIIDQKNASDIEKIISSFEKLDSAFSNSDFLLAIESPSISDDEKLSLVLSLIESPTKDLENFIKLLASSKRLEIIPSVIEELKVELSLKSNSYRGTVYTDSSLEESYINSLEKELSKRFDIDLSLTQKVCDYDGLKVYIDVLDVEVGLSRELVQNQIINSVLNAI